MCVYWHNQDRRMQEAIGFLLIVMKNEGNFRRGSVELMILYLLSKRDYYGYELSLIIKEESDNVLDIPVGSLYPALYKLIDLGYISDYQKKVGKRKVRIYYHLEDSGAERLKMLTMDYEETTKAIQKVLSYEPKIEQDK